MTQYDGNKPARWIDTEWQPAQIRHQITKQKIASLKTLARALIAEHQMGKQNLTKMQIEQLRQRGYNV